MIVFFTVLCFYSGPGSAGTPRVALPAKAVVVVVSIKPIHSLVCAVMEGVGGKSSEPLLLMQAPGQSPHTFVLKPSDVLIAKSADLFIWVGPAYETHIKTVVERGPKAFLTLMEVKGLTLYPPRQGGLWGSGHEHHHHDDQSHAHDHDYIPLAVEDLTREKFGNDRSVYRIHEDREQIFNDAQSFKSERYTELYDGHIWLDPNNAKVIAIAVAERLSVLDPEHKDQYQANAAALCQRLDQLKHTLTERLQIIRDKPYIVTHDAYVYWDHAFGTKASGAVFSDPERPASIAHRLQLQRTIARWQDEGKTVCLFAEPQLPAALVQKLGESAKTKSAVIDPLGDAVPAGKDAYFIMMIQLADTMIQALK